MKFEFPFNSLENKHYIIQEHYKFIYETLEEASICGSTWFPVNALSQQLKFKSMKHPITRMNEYQREYQVSCESLNINIYRVNENVD